MPRSRLLLQRASAKSGAAKREREKEWGRRECIKGEKGEKRPLDARKNGKSLNNSRLNAHTHTRARKGERERVRGEGKRSTLRESTSIKGILLSLSHKEWGNKSFLSLPRRFPPRASAVLWSTLPPQRERLAPASFCPSPHLLCPRLPVLFRTRCLLKKPIALFFYCRATYISCVNAFHYELGAMVSSSSSSFSINIWI